MKLKTLYIILFTLVTLHAPKYIVSAESIVVEPTLTVTATMYNALEAQCDADPFITAGMYRINPNKASQHRWVALSRNLLDRWGGKFDYGDMIRISGAGHKDGIYKVVDTMNKRFKDRLDFLETAGTKIYKFKNVIIEKVGT